MTKKPRPAAYGGDTILTVLNTLSGRIEKRQVMTLEPAVHCVYSITKNKFVPLVHLVKLGTMKRALVIRKTPPRRSPLQDVYLTKNVRILSQGKAIRVRDLLAERIGCSTDQILVEKIVVAPSPRYILVTTESDFIMVSGIAVQTRGVEEIEKYLQKRP